MDSDNSETSTKSANIVEDVALLVPSKGPDTTLKLLMTGGK